LRHRALLLYRGALEDSGTVMTRLAAAAVAAVLLGSFSARPASAQATTEDVQKQIDALRAAIQALQKDVTEMKQALARATPRTAAVGATIDVSDRPVRGDPSAKVTLVEFSDYECPFCASYVRATYPAIEAAYVKTGKVRTVFVDTPLVSIHKDAFKAAQAASCAREQGKYWEMHDELFQSQDAFEPWVSHAKAVGLDVPRFQECLASDRHDAQIRHDMGEARQLGLTSTPSFLIGHASPDDGAKIKVVAVVRGAAPFADFKSAIDPILETEAASPAK
jgi:protein-disulfide isomerase